MSREDGICGDTQDILNSESQQFFENLTETWEDKLNFVKLLHHSAVHTNKSQKSMTYLLQLIKAHEPASSYFLLPNAGKKLARIDGRDISYDKAGLSKRLPSPTVTNDGKYVHLGLENALSGILRVLSIKIQIWFSSLTYTSKIQSFFRN